MIIKQEATENEMIVECNSARGDKHPIDRLEIFLSISMVY